MRVLDLFSGIGGFSLGLERAGMETVAFCEWDAKARQVLAKHWPEVPCYHDVKDLTKERLDQDGITDIRLICGGYPCQPFSTAGKRLGQEDDRHLWPEVLRLVQEIRPAWVLCENVAGHISMGLDSVLADLDGIGYDSQALVIPACAVDAPHRRDRVWIVANAKLYGRYKGIAGNSGSKATAGRKNRDIAYRLHKRAWAIEPNSRRVAYGVPGRVDRLKQLGNAVVPQVVEVIGRAIMEANNDG